MSKQAIFDVLNSFGADEVIIGISDNNTHDDVLEYYRNKVNAINKIYPESQTIMFGFTFKDKKYSITMTCWYDEKENSIDISMDYDWSDPVPTDKINKLFDVMMDYLS